MENTDTIRILLKNTTKTPKKDGNTNGKIQLENYILRKLKIIR